MITWNHEGEKLYDVLGYENEEALLYGFENEEAAGEIGMAIALLEYLTTKEAAPLILLLGVIYPDITLDRPSNIVELMLPLILKVDNKVQIMSSLIRCTKKDETGIDDLFDEMLGIR